MTHSLMLNHGGAVKEHAVDVWSGREQATWDVLSQPTYEESYIVFSCRRCIPRHSFDKGLDGKHERMIRRVVARCAGLAWERGRNRLRKVMSHAKRISATPTRPRKATLVHHRPKQKCIAPKWTAFGLYSQARISPRQRRSFLYKFAF